MNINEEHKVIEVEPNCEECKNNGITCIDCDDSKSSFEKLEPCSECSNSANFGTRCIKCGYENKLLIVVKRGANQFE